MTAPGGMMPRSDVAMLQATVDQLAHQQLPTQQQLPAYAPPPYAQLAAQMTAPGGVMPRSDVAMLQASVDQLQTELVGERHRANEIAEGTAKTVAEQKKNLANVTSSLEHVTSLSRDRESKLQAEASAAAAQLLQER